MSETATGLIIVGPDYFTCYAHQVKDLVAECQDSSSPLEMKGKDAAVERSGSLFEDGVGAGLSDSRKERLHLLLRQAVKALTPEVDEMLDPVVNMRQLQSKIRSKMVVSNNAGPTATNGAEKAQTRSTTQFSEHSACCDASSTTEWVVGPKGKMFCGSCGTSAENDCKSCSFSTSSPKNGSNKEDDDLQFLLENDSSIVEETLKEYSDKLIATLDHMEMHLETLLDVVMSTCGPMTLAEKLRLQKLIQKLPPKNLDRVAEIVQRRKLVQRENCSEIFVSLDQEDNLTLWRLYYYVEAVEKARILSMNKTSAANAQQ